MTGSERPDAGEVTTVPPLFRGARLASRLRISTTVIGTLAVVALEFGLLHLVYHHGDANRRDQTIVAHLNGQVTGARLARSSALVKTVQNELTTLHVADSRVRAVQRSAASFDRTPNGHTLAVLRTSTRELERQLIDDSNRLGVEADLVYVVLLVVASLGWMVWFRRLVARHRKLQQAFTEAQSTARGEQRLATMVRNSADLVLLCTVEGDISFATPSARGVLGIEPEDLIGCNFLDFVELDDRQNFAVALSTLRLEEDRDIGVRMHHADGRVLNLEGTVTDLSVDPSVEALLITVRDVTTRVDLEEQLRHQAFYDSLTQLANRQLFTDRLTHALARRPASALDGVAVLFCDLDEFKNINDSIGHRIGDLVLAEVARRAVSVTGAGDTVARLGGDEFAILLEDADLSSATAAAESMLETLDRPIEADGHLLNVRASVGLALSSSDATTGEELLRNADVAMYLAKERGKSTIAAYDGELHSLLLDRITLHTELETALVRNELAVHYQPIVELGNRCIVGFEALVRWKHPTRGMLAPAAFIPIAERTGLIHALGGIVLRSACLAGMEFTRVARRPISVSVNVTAQQLGRADYVAEVEEALIGSGLPGSQLTIEITESVLLADVTQTIEHLANLRQIGVRIALDDFGTGYSSLAYLRDLPLDVLKVDKAFIDRVVTDPNDAALTQAILHMSLSMNLTTVAEGVEHAHQAEWLTHSRCTYGQGYFWSRPVPELEAVSLIGPTTSTTISIPAPDSAETLSDGRATTSTSVSA